jgi:hypothetical protein
MRVVLGLLAAITGWAAVPAAHAALPIPGESYTVHDHNTPGDNWHVQVDVSKDGRGASVVVHTERCGKHTPFAKWVPIDADGVAKTYRDLKPGKPERGRWSFESRFTENHRLDGTFRVVTPTCDSGPMIFVAHSGQHIHYGTPMGQYPDLSRARPKRLEQAEWLWMESWRWAKRFKDVERARSLGYFSGDGDFVDRRAHVYHLRHLPFTKDKVYFNAKKTESLMYYNGLEGPPVLVGYMYRYPLGGQPAFASPMLGWHAHGTGRWRGVPNQMTHIWLTNDLRTAMANCMPVEALEAAIPEFEFSPMQPDVIQEARPCPSG